MPSLAVVKSGLVLMLVVVLGLFVGTPHRRLPANVDGYVYQTCSGERLVGPVAGALVSTSVDATTARTDANGHFEIRTERPVFSDVFYTVSARAGDTTVTDRLLLTNGVSNAPRHVSFVLSPPEPVFARVDRSGQRTLCAAYPHRHVQTAGP